jgi:hypothetical protein
VVSEGKEPGARGDSCDDLLMCDVEVCRLKAIERIGITANRQTEFISSVYKKITGSVDPVFYFNKLPKTGML